MNALPNNSFKLTPLRGAAWFGRWLALRNSKECLRDISFVSSRLGCSDSALPPARVRAHR